MLDALREPKFIQRRRSSWRASSLLLVSKRAVAELVEGVFLREAAATRASSRGWREPRAIAFFWTANKTCVTICGATTTLAFEEYYTAHAGGHRHYTILPALNEEECISNTKTESCETRRREKKVGGKKCPKNFATSTKTKARAHRDGDPQRNLSFQNTERRSN